MSTIINGEDGQTYIDNSDGLAVTRAKAVCKRNCQITLKMHSDRVEYFRRRAIERGEPDSETIIILANVDTPYGYYLAEQLMPGNEQQWQKYRDLGQVPFARGLAKRSGVQNFLRKIDLVAANKLEAHTGLAVVVVDHGVAEVF